MSFTAAAAPGSFAFRLVHRVVLLKELSDDKFGICQYFLQRKMTCSQSSRLEGVLCDN